MFRSFVSVAVGHLLARKLESALNILGLAVGLASCLLIALFLRHELGYESGFDGADRIYRISRDYYPRGARPRVPASVNAPVAPALVADFASVEQVGRVFGGGVLLARDDGRFGEEAARSGDDTARFGEEAARFREDAVRFADNSLFEVFDFGWIEGDPADALARPRTIVLTASLARKYFGDEDALGRTLTLENAAPLEVTGVIDDLPDDTHLRLDGLISMPTLAALFGPAALEQWNSFTDFHTYFRLRPGASIDSVTQRLPEFLTRHIGEEAAAVSGLTVMNVRDIHLHSTRDEEWRIPGSMATVYGFGAIAAGILLIACINFMNLSTARAAQRAREVAMRKALGATRGRLVAQFLGESVLVAVVAMVVAVSLTELTLPAFSTFLGATLPFAYWRDPVLLGLLAGLTLLVGIGAGSYPAFYLSAFRPARVLKGELTRGGGGAVFRDILVVAQFSIAIGLLIGLAVVYRQTAYAHDIDLGFDRERVVVLTASPRQGFGEQWQAFRQELVSHPAVESVTASHFTPFMFDDNHLGVRRQGQEPVRIQFMGVDFDFFETYRIDVLAGRIFSREFGADAVAAPRNLQDTMAGGVVLNRAAADVLGFASPEDSVGRTVQVGADGSGQGGGATTVVGVVSDTHFESVRKAVRPLIYVLVPTLSLGRNFHMPYASVRLAPGDPAPALAHIDATWRTFLPDQPISRHFLDADFEAMYQQERRQEVLLGWFSGLAILVACVGLLGLAAFNAERRTREIGIRKAMGGSTSGIVMLLSRQFGKLVLAANLVAWPAAYLIMRNWLDKFAYRIDLDPLVFVAAAVLALLVAWVTVGGIAARAARANPVHALRYE